MTQSVARNGQKTKIGGQFSSRLVEMLSSPAYRVLSLSAHRILARLEIELGQHGGKDNGRLPVTFDHFEEYGIHRHAIGPAIREVVALGFVEITRQGRSGNGEFRCPTLYRLTYRATDRTGSTDEWQAFDTLAAAEIASATARNVKMPGRKNRKPVVVSAKFRCGKRTENDGLPVAVSTTTSTSAVFATTSISREENKRDDGGQAEARPTQKAGASDLPHDVERIGTFTPALLRTIAKKKWRAPIEKSGGRDG